MNRLQGMESLPRIISPLSQKKAGRLDSSAFTFVTLECFDSIAAYKMEDQEKVELEVRKARTCTHLAAACDTPV